MATQSEKGKRFRELHGRDHAFIIPNPWDAGSARLLEHLGFEALATTSAGHAFSMGRADGACTRDEVLEHLSALAAATALPVSADLGNGFGDSPEHAAETVKLAAATGIVGCSIEDATGREGDPIYEMSLAVERVLAASEAARSLPFPFMLTARAENFLHGRRDLEDTIARLQAFQRAGADVLYAPGLTTGEEIAAVVSSVDRPVNALAGLQGATMNAAGMSALGVKRISVGGSLCRAALGALLRAGREMRDHGTFNFVADAVSYSVVNGLFATPPEGTEEE
ncbi:MAG TPA: isocitrate lyase/phosphoenolpyruvate mutase family protein [Terracidiphilus sp.]|nr:isocitrate lyase/phosphoenolpyruvate mutase family protein [Terracidiphilus sp.]